MDKIKVLCRIEEKYNNEEYISLSVCFFCRERKNELTKACLFGMDAMLFRQFMQETGND